MHILRDLRRRFHYYRYEDLPPETQEALDQCDEFERSLAEKEAREKSEERKDQ